MCGLKPRPFKFPFAIEDSGSAISFTLKDHKVASYRYLRYLEIIYCVDTVKDIAINIPENLDLIKQLIYDDYTSRT
jgi:hypothetical protein